MKKFMTSAVFILAFAGYALNQYLGSASSAVATSAPSETVSGQSVAVNTSANEVASTQRPTNAPQPSQPAQQPSQPSQTKTTSSVPTPAPAPKPRGQYVDGTYTGSAFDAYYGNVQVRVSIRSGKIADVAFLQYPNDRNTSRMINSQAMPLLKQEAISAQNAHVDGVSGATDTSMAFQESLSSALSKARG